MTSCVLISSLFVIIKLNSICQQQLKKVFANSLSFVLTQKKGLSNSLQSYVLQKRCPRFSEMNLSKW